jgi:hypothetical protein
VKKLRQLPQRVRLQSWFGRLVYAFVALGSVQPVASIVWLAFHFLRGGSFEPRFVTCWVFYIPQIAVAELARRYGVGLCATPAGLELGFPKRVIPWQDVSGVTYQPLLSSFLPCFLLKLKNSYVPLYFYGKPDTERVVARFQKAASV